jgi:hypothetical protein
MNKVKMTNETTQTESPQFLAIWDEIHQNNFNEDVTSEKAATLLRTLIESASPEFSDMLLKELEQSGAIPKTLGYTEEGIPVCSLADFAEKFNLTLEEADQRTQQLAVKYGNVMSFDLDKIHIAV